MVKGSRMSLKSGRRTYPSGFRDDFLTLLLRRAGFRGREITVRAVAENARVNMIRGSRVRRGARFADETATQAQRNARAK